MLNKLINQIWHAWIDTQPVQSTAGTLHVVGEIVTHPSQVAVLIRKVPQGINPRILMLEIVLQASRIPTKQPQQLKYAEAVESLEQYGSIDVLHNGKILITITDIPVIK